MSRRHGLLVALMGTVALWCSPTVASSQQLPAFGTLDAGDMPLCLVLLEAGRVSDRQSLLSGTPYFVWTASKTTPGQQFGQAAWRRFGPFTFTSNQRSVFRSSDSLANDGRRTSTAINPGRASLSFETGPREPAWFIVNPLPPGCGGGVPPPVAPGSQDLPTFGPLDPGDMPRCLIWVRVGGYAEGQLLLSERPYFVWTAPQRTAGQAFRQASWRRFGPFTFAGRQRSTFISGSPASNDRPTSTEISPGLASLSFENVGNPWPAWFIVNPLPPGCGGGAPPPVKPVPAGGDGLLEGKWTISCCNDSLGWTMSITKHEGSTFSGSFSSEYQGGVVTNGQLRGNTIEFDRSGGRWRQHWSAQLVNDGGRVRMINGIWTGDYLDEFQGRNNWHAEKNK